MKRRISFRTKLFVSLVLVVVITTFLGYTLIHLAVDRAFQHFVAERSRTQSDTLVQVLVRSLAQARDKDDMLGLLTGAGRPLPLVVADMGGNVIYAPDESKTGIVLPEEELEHGTRIRLQDGTDWVVVRSWDVRSSHTTPERRFLEAVTVSLWIAGGTVTILGIGIGFLLLRQLTRPLNRLAAAAREVGRGEFARRVPVETRDELGRLARSFNEMAESLERSERAKRRMIADISHELRTPLNAVRNGLEGLRDGIIAPTPENLAALHSKVMLTARLVDDLHQLALADSDRLPLNIGPVDLRELIDGIRMTIGPELDDEGVALVVDLPPDLPMIEADGQRIEQVILNLLENAMRYTPSGKEIRIAAAAVEGGAVEVSVCDSGPGLSEDDLEHAFDRFYRADPARARKSGGSGLGLAIAKAIVEAHNGRIWAENNQDGGACFRFVIPGGTA